MPGFDGTGPAGAGPFTGGGRGYCAVNLDDIRNKRMDYYGVPAGPLSVVRDRYDGGFLSRRGGYAAPSRDPGGAYAPGAAGRFRMIPRPGFFHGGRRPMFEGGRGLGPACGGIRGRRTAIQGTRGRGSACGGTRGRGSRFGI